MNIQPHRVGKLRAKKVKQLEAYIVQGIRGTEFCFVYLDWNHGQYHDT